MPRPHELRLKRLQRVLLLLKEAKDGIDWNELVRVQVSEFEIGQPTAVALLNDITIGGLASSRYGHVRITERGRKSVVP